MVDNSSKRFILRYSALVAVEAVAAELVVDDVFIGGDGTRVTKLEIDLHAS
jgi:hypothetical protein